MADCLYWLKVQATGDPTVVDSFYCGEVPCYYTIPEVDYVTDDPRCTGSNNGYSPTTVADCQKGIARRSSIAEYSAFIESASPVTSCMVERCACASGHDARTPADFDACCGAGACCKPNLTCSVIGYSSCASAWGNDHVQASLNWYPGIGCGSLPASSPCSVSKRCCHCDWCCKVGSGGITETACTSAGGLVQSGTCPASGPCTTTNCKPCLLEGFSLALNRTGSTQSMPGGYQPIAQIKAIDDSGVDTTRVMHATLAAKNGENQYAARSCNIYNRRIGGGDVTKRRAVSECSLVASPGGYGYQFVCPWREPCSEPPTGCVRSAA